MNAIDGKAGRHQVSVSASEVAEAPHEVRERTVLGLTGEGWLRILAPLLVGMVSLGAWQWVVVAKGVPTYILPGPVDIVQALVANWETLQVSLWITLQITFAALFVAALLGPPWPCCSRSPGWSNCRCSPMR
jgi:NitT/TauT family transport system permease protein